MLTITLGAGSWAGVFTIITLVNVLPPPAQLSFLPWWGNQPENGRTADGEATQTSGHLTFGAVSL